MRASHLSAATFTSNNKTTQNGTQPDPGVFQSPELINLHDHIEVWGLISMAKLHQPLDSLTRGSQRAWDVCLGKMHI